MHTTMRNIYYLFSLFTLILISSACQDKDIEREGMKLNAIDEKVSSVNYKVTITSGPGRNKIICKCRLQLIPTAPKAEPY